MADLADPHAPVPTSTGATSTGATSAGARTAGASTVGAPAVTALDIEPWPDPVIDQLGHDPRSLYVERFWLGILGPSTILLVRRLADELDAEPGGFRLELTDTARALGLGDRGGRHSPFLRTIDRMCRFGAAEWRGVQTLAVRRHLAPLTRSQVARLSPTLREQHDTWTRPTDSDDDAHRQQERARGLALALLELGEEPEAVERLLHRWQFHPALAHDAVRRARAQRAGAAAAPDDRRRPARRQPVAAMASARPAQSYRVPAPEVTRFTVSDGSVPMNPPTASTDSPS